MFHGMLCESLLPEIVGFSTAISACEKRSQWQQAWLLFEAGNVLKKIGASLLSQWRNTSKLLGVTLGVTYL